ncbi:MAG: pyrroline-5-carboxylate reductase [Phycisphaeraceae bacterium]|nr:pyrroline-5-carboxylate reductase [Phycisphaeraceae bacterium]MCW5763871.1 pyrroline-5-carboxylate reductase [Phycisphaeraceae bacterium]
MHTYLAIIGGGTMAQAIVHGAAHILENRVVVADPSPERRALFPHAVDTADQAIRWLTERETPHAPGQILLAVKPQMLPAVALDMRPALDDGSWGERIVISILAGTRAVRVAAAFDGAARVIRVMPNTPAQIGRGMSALCISRSATQADAALARDIFTAVGRVIELDEDHFDAFTAVAGSGPAYVFLLAQALLRGALEAGLTEHHALLAVRETIAGAGLLLASSDDAPADLRARVTSRGGTTAAALDVLEQAGVADALVRAVLAARDRGQALDRASSGTTLA